MVSLLPASSSTSRHRAFSVQPVGQAQCESGNALFYRNGDAMWETLRRFVNQRRCIRCNYQQYLMLLVMLRVVTCRPMNGVLARFVIHLTTQTEKSVKQMTTAVDVLLKTLPFDSR